MEFQFFISGMMVCTLTGGMPTAWNAFVLEIWDSGVVVVKSRAKNGCFDWTLLARDIGWMFYCHQVLEMIILLSICYRMLMVDPNHISNLVLAHDRCNKQSWAYVYFWKS